FFFFIFIFICFLFYSFVFSLNLLSFPTRRSSDLEKDSVERLVYQIDSYKEYFDYCYIVCVDKNLDAVRKKISTNVGIIVVDDIKDRKSTRLNSSHVSISYAVFCLKKKKTQVNLKI